jgi:hypothetical protein
MWRDAVLLPSPSPPSPVPSLPSPPEKAASQVPMSTNRRRIRHITRIEIKVLDYVENVFRQVARCGSISFAITAIPSFITAISTRERCPPDTHLEQHKAHTAHHQNRNERSLACNVCLLPRRSMQSSLHRYHRHTQRHHRHPPVSAASQIPIWINRRCIPGMTRIVKYVL